MLSFFLFFFLYSLGNSYLIRNNYRQSPSVCEICIMSVKIYVKKNVGMSRGVINIRFRNEILR